MLAFCAIGREAPPESSRLVCSSAPSDTRRTVGATKIRSSGPLNSQWRAWIDPSYWTRERPSASGTMRNVSIEPVSGPSTCRHVIDSPGSRVARSVVTTVPNQSCVV
jgi:hypothetical protein